MIYLDNAATAMPLPLAVKAASEAMSECFGNPSSLHHMGRQAAKLLEESRASVAAALGCKPGNIIFTSGGTEAANTAIMSAALKSQRRRHIISTAVEHEATLSVLGELKTRHGCDITLVPPDKDGTVSASSVLEAVGPNTALIAMQAVNNETGAIMPYAQVADAINVAKAKPLFFLDAVQGLLRLQLRLENIDFAAVSAHKIGGIKGCGALYCASPAGLRPLHLGGGQENNLRSGTEAMPAIAAFGEACRVRLQGFASGTAHMAALKAALPGLLREAGVRFVINSPENAAPHIINISPHKGRSEVYIRVLSDAGICISGGSACKRGKRSHVLEAMHLPAGVIDSALRVSLSPENTMEELEAFARALAKAQELF